MGRKQSRRSISVTGPTYGRLVLAQQMGVIPGSISGLLEDLIAAKLDAAGVPKVDKGPERKPAAPKPKRDEPASGHWTF